MIETGTTIITTGEIITGLPTETWIDL